MTEPVLSWSGEKIRSMCRYIKDDRMIAGYVGIDVSEVRRIRTTLPARYLGRPKPAHDMVYEPIYRSDSESRASDALSRRMWRHFNLRALERGCDIYEAMVHCGMRA